MFKKLEEWLNVVSENMEDVKVTQIEFLEIKSIISKMKNTLHGINIRWAIAKENISELEDIAIEYPKWNTERKQNKTKKQN